MEILILTGMSGSGKSVAVNSLEDIGFFCIDNLPPQLLSDMVIKLARPNQGEGIGMKRLAVVVDSRSAEYFPVLDDSLQELHKAGLPYKILFLDASNETLISRYKQTRRNHPLAEEGGILSGINKERELLTPLRERSDLILNTDKQSPKELANKVISLIDEDLTETDRFQILVQSFGFKYGLPEDSDLVADVRFLPNPFYIDELRPLSGQDPELKAYVYSYPETKIFLEKQLDSLLFLMPYYIREGKAILTISVGCTGGRHRSVFLAGEIAKRLRQHDYQVTLIHRDIAKDLLK